MVSGSPNIQVFSSAVCLVDLVDRGLRKHLLPIVAGSLERDRQRHMTFEQFFERANNFFSLKVYHVRCLDTFVLHRLYLPETAT